VARYFEFEGGIAPELDYLSGLLKQARRVGKQAVLGFSRSLARASAIRQALGGCHVVIRRDPRQQWLSCRSYRVAGGTLYFELCHFLILALAPPRSPAGLLARHLGLPRPPEGSFGEQFRFMQQALWPWTDELSYRAFLGVHRLSHAAAAAAADLTIDVDRLSRDSTYRSEVRTEIFTRTGIAARFDDCHIGRHDTEGVAFDFGAVERSVARLLGVCDSRSHAEDRPGARIHQPGIAAPARAL